MLIKVQHKVMATEPVNKCCVSYSASGHTLATGAWLSTTETYKSPNVLQEEANHRSTGTET